MSKEMKQLWDNFNKYGIFPNDKQMTQALGADIIHSALTCEKVELYYNKYHLEMEMINTAINDINHPYHKKVTCNE